MKADSNSEGIFARERKEKEKKRGRERERELIVLTINYFVFNYTLFCVLKKWQM